LVTTLLDPFNVIPLTDTSVEPLVIAIRLGAVQDGAAAIVEFDPESDIIDPIVSGLFETR
jgi:hypothetical protein